jgi:hypothetical protein
MKSTKFLASALVCSAVIGPIACGGQEASTDDLALGDDNGSIDPGSDGSPSGGETLNGGTKTLTGDQVNAIKNAECSGYTGEAEPAPAILQFVVDVSGSMRAAAPGGGGSKWDVTRAALLRAIDDLPASMAVGLQLFPTAEPPGTCVDGSGSLAIDQLGPAGSAHRTALEDRISRANLYNSTPTHDAYQFAIEQSLKPYGGEGKKFMLVITDGAPTLALGCEGNAMDEVETAPIVAEVTAAAAAGIGTFVVGSPGSERSMADNDMRPWLSAAAREGGTPRPGCSDSGPTYCHFDMSAEPNFAQALADGLRNITGSVSNPCSFDVPSDAPNGTTIDAKETHIIVESSSGAALIVRDDTGDCTEGWKLAANGQIELCQATCDRVKGDTSARVTLSFGCAAGEIPGIE